MIKIILWFLEAIAMVGETFSLNEEPEEMNYFEIDTKNWRLYSKPIKTFKKSTYKFFNKVEDLIVKLEEKVEKDNY